MASNELGLRLAADAAEAPHVPVALDADVDGHPAAVHARERFRAGRTGDAAGADERAAISHGAPPR